MTQQVRLEKLERQIGFLRAELALRTLMYPTMGNETPPEHRIHGQHAAYDCGFENAWRGQPKNNCYSEFTAQYRAWNRGFSDGCKAFCTAYTKAIRKSMEGAK